MPFSILSNSVLNVEALVGAFNHEKALEWAFSVIVQLHRLIVYSTSHSQRIWAMSKCVNELTAGGYSYMGSVLSIN